VWAARDTTVWTFLLVGLGFSASRIGAGAGLVTGRRWGWVLGVLLGLMALVALALFPPSADLAQLRASAFGLLLELGTGVVTLTCLLTPATIRWVGPARRTRRWLDQVVQAASS